MRIFKNIVLILVLLLLIVLEVLAFHEMMNQVEPDFSKEHLAEVQERYKDIISDYQGMKYHNEELILEIDDNSTLKLKNDNGRISIEILMRDEMLKAIYPIRIENDTLNIGTQYVQFDEIKRISNTDFVILITVVTSCIIVVIYVIVLVNKNE